MSESKRLYAIRGAVCAQNTGESIQDNVAQLYSTIIKQNSFVDEDIVSIQFTSTGDLTALNPAAALRKAGYASAVPLFCALEPNIEGSLALTIRIMITVYMKHPPVAVYINGAQVLRPDIAHGQ